MKDSALLLETIYVSADPYMCGRKEDAESYVAPRKLHQIIESGAIGKVIESHSNPLNKKDIASGMFG